MNATEKRETVNLLVTARDAINEAIGHINRPANEYWVWRKLSDNYSDQQGYAGVEDENAKICDVIVDGFSGDFIAESTTVGVYFEDDADPQQVAFIREFPTDRFYSDSNIGYSFAEWAVSLMENKAFGLDDIQDILGMKKQ